MENSLSIFSYSFILLSLSRFCTAVDSISQNQTISYGETLLSPGQVFELGFFSLSGSINRYLGIWYKRTPQTFVWIANRQHPINSSNGVLTFSPDGNLVILDGEKRVVWTTNSSSKTVQGSSAQLLDSGNFVLRGNNDLQAQSYIWQSFDLPYDTLLPGMRMDWTSSTNEKSKYLTAWRSINDPSPGDITYRIENIGVPQFVLRKGLEKKFRSGIWNGVRFSGYAVMSNPYFKFHFVHDNGDWYYAYEVIDNSITSKLSVTESGLLQRSLLTEGSSDWDIMYTVPNDLCDNYGHCGSNGICRVSRTPICECLDGFTPKSLREWDTLEWSGGCVRNTQLDCQKGEGFVRLRHVKLPELLNFRLNQSMSLQNCKKECFKDCSCTAFANSVISGGGNGCLIWYGDLIDLREFSQETSEQDIYIRMPASELDKHLKKKWIVVITVVSSGFGVIVLIILAWSLTRKRKPKPVLITDDEDFELPSFDLVTLSTATDSFSHVNIIGEGGFGPVYKGKLVTGAEIAVKRLSKDSGQGIQEFKNEIILISKLQHRNLVRLVGCCLDGEERILVYEYMPNKSLDFFIFDQRRKESLSWKNRFEIALGVSRGLLYLHQDSRLRIIHRDLKASNVLLDGDLNPKISDFGLARIFGRNQTEGTTRRVIGTYGYMAPEYAVDGKFSTKSDVFSFGVLLLEIVSGRKNRMYFHTDHDNTLLGHAWLVWIEGKSLQLLEECLKHSYDESQVLRCIQVGLLCVQKRPENRPTMASVVFMLGSEDMVLPQPKEPGFFIDRSSTEKTALMKERSLTENEMTVTVEEGR